MDLKLCSYIVDILKICIWDFDRARINFVRIRPFELRHFGQLFCIIGYGVSVINSSYSFQWMFLNLHRIIVDIFKMCKWVLIELELI